MCVKSVPLGKGKGCDPLLLFCVAERGERMQSAATHATGGIAILTERSVLLAGRSDVPEVPTRRTIYLHRAISQKVA
jgi:hypothetical protein